MILVAGGSGRLGARVVSRLAGRGFDVRVFSRGTKPAVELPGTVDIVVGDVRDQASVDAAMHDVSLVVSAVQGFAGKGRVSPASVDREGNRHLIDAATKAGAEFVLMSVVGASPDGPMGLYRAKYDAEQYVRERSSAWSVVRATAFLELWAEIMSKPIVFGRGDNPINFVSVEDVAAAVERVVVDGAYRGRVVEVGGPENLTFNELGALLHDSRERRTKLRHVPRLVLRAASPFARPARAAVVMDTTDMRFDAAQTREAFPDLTLTDARTALVAMAAAERRPV